MADVTAVLRALVDAAFSTGGITDTQHTELLGLLDAPDAPAEEPAPAPEPAPEPPAAPASPPVTPAFGQESNPYA